MKLINTLYVSMLQAFGSRVFNSSGALLSQGMTLAHGDAASPEVFTAFTDVVSIDGPTGQAPEIDVTDLSSAAREFILGLEDEGEITMEVNYKPADTGHALFRTRKAAGTLNNYRITFTDAGPTTWTFAAYVKGLQVSNAIDGVTKASVSLRLTGAVAEA